MMTGVDAWADVFEGFEDVPWTTMKHAYGKADDVLTELPKLASDDSEERTGALGFLWHGVHHQGDIYDSTVAALPFLVRAAVAAGFPDRDGILDLLASIGGYSLSNGGATEPREQEPGWLPMMRQAYAGVLAGTPGYLAALQDPDVQLRYSAVKVLQYCRRERALVMPALHAALSTESHPEVQVALINGYLAIASAEPFSASVDETAQQWLLDLLADETQRPHIRLAALIQVAERIADRVPADAVDLALGLAEGLRGNEPDSDDSAGGLLAGVNRALGERVGDRMVLISHELDAGRGERAIDALRLARSLMQDFRGDFTELLQRVGGHLVHATEPDVRIAAISALEELGEVAAPACDAIVEVLEHAPREYEDEGTDPLAKGTAWMVVHSSHGPQVGNLVAVLARARDPRVVPILRTCLEQPALVRDLGQAIGAAGPVAAELVRRVREHISRLTANDSAAKQQLAYALGRIGPAAADAAPDLVAMLEDGLAAAQGSATTAQRSATMALNAAATALGLIGPTAAAAPGAVDVLRRMLDHEDQYAALNAATALAHITPDDALLRPFFEGVFVAPKGRPVAAAEGLALLGPGPGTAPDALLARLDQLLEDSDGWGLAAAAIALWHTTGESARAVPALRRAWESSHHTRRYVAHHAAGMGPAAAGLESLLQAELAAVRRHNRPAGSTVWSTADVENDEELLRKVRVALEKITGP
ncbi:MAG TPA: hypothetical protein VGM10_32180 [Actinocrinis sp.]|jgi:hypothetical protein